MHTRWLMIGSALFAGLVGVAASFFAGEWLGILGMAPEPGGVLVVQAGGAAYLGFAMLNWTARGNLIGGIYGRPVALANFLHFAVVAIALVKSIDDGVTGPVLAALLPYGLFAIWFGLVLFGSPRIGTEHAS